MDPSGPIHVFDIFIDVSVRYIRLSELAGNLACKSAGIACVSGMVCSRLYSNSSTPLYRVTILIDSINRQRWNRMGYLC